MNAPKNDWLALTVANPEASVADFVASGFDSTNTTIASADSYAKFTEVQTNPLFLDAAGNFSQNKFQKYYDNSVQSYNLLDAATPKESKYNIFANVDDIDWNPTTQVVKGFNPDRITKSITEIGMDGPRLKSRAEIAQSQNAFDFKTGKWLNSPNDSFWSTITGNNYVMATWDYDADEHGRKTDDPNKVVYRKGDYKYNEDGTYYYETASGRDTHDKEVLAWSDVLTTDGSFMNKFDILDNDDLTHSPWKATIKNAALVGALYTPYVGTIVGGALLLNNMVNMGSTFGKMVLGADNPLMNDVATWAKATNIMSTRSEYAKDPDNTWAWENLVSLAGDSISQIKQQRMLFKYAPAIFKGKAGYSDEAYAAMEKSIYDKAYAKGSKEVFERINKLTTSSIQNLNGFAPTAKAAALEAVEANSRSLGAKAMREYVKNYNALGEAIGRTYMVGLTTHDMFNEATRAGADHLTATMMTLGLAAAENQLLKTNLGRWVFPEFQAERAAVKNAIKSISKNTVRDLNTQLSNAVTPEQKKSWIKEAFNYGKKLITGNLDGQLSKTQMFVANGLAEGLEEISEEALADSFRYMHDSINTLTKSGHKNMFTTQGIFNKYAQNFLGGFIGGGGSTVLEGFNSAGNYSNVSNEEAMKLLINKMRNGETDEIYKTIEKLDFGSKTLSTELALDSENQNPIGYLPATDGRKSQHEVVKNVITNQIKLIEDTLNSTGANISDNTLLSKATLEDLRFTFLQDTASASRYLEVFRNKSLEMVKAAQALKDIDVNSTDDTKKDSQEYEAKRQQLQEAYNEKKKDLQEFLDGKYSSDFMTAALLSTNKNVLREFTKGATFQSFAEALYNKELSQFSDKEKQDAILQYQEYVQSEKADDDLAASDAYINLTNRFMRRLEESKTNRGEFTKKFEDHLQGAYLSLRAMLRMGIDQTTYLHGADLNAQDVIQTNRKQILGTIRDIDSDLFDSELKSLIDEANELSKDSSKDAERLTTENKIDRRSHKILNKFISDYVKENKDGWSNDAVKSRLKNLLLANRTYYDNIVMKAFDGYTLEQEDFQALKDITGKDYDANTVFNALNDVKNTFDSLEKDLNDLETSPIYKILDELYLDISGRSISYSKLMEAISSEDGYSGLKTLLATYSKNIEGFEVSDQDVLNTLEQALKATRVINGLIQGARISNMGFTVEENYDNNEEHHYSIQTDLFGINATINEIRQKRGISEKLATLTEEQAATHLKELAIINKQLQFFKDLHTVNRGQKLSRQPKVEVQMARATFDAFKRIYIAAFPEEWKKEVEDVINTYENIEWSVGNFNQVVEAKMAIQMALHNLSKKFPDPSPLLDNLDKLNIFGAESTINDTEQAYFSDLDFYRMMAACAAINPMDFYNDLANNQANDLAPLAPQVHLAFHNKAMIYNREVMNKYRQVLQKKMHEHYDNLDYVGRKKIAQHYASSEVYAAILATDGGKHLIKSLMGPRFDNIFFSSGGPGTGKSDAVLTMALAGIQNDPNFKGVWVAHSTKANAQRILESNKLEENDHTKAFDSQELLEFISNYQKPNVVNDVAEYEEGTHYTVTDGIPSPIVSTKTQTNLPNVIVIDEVSRYTDLEIGIIEKFAEQYGIPVLAYGDIRQIKAEGTLKIGIDPAAITADIKKWDSNLANGLNLPDHISFNTSIANENFLTAPILEDSLRTSNTQSTKNNMVVRLASEQKARSVNLTYYEGKDVTGKDILNGSKVLSESDTQEIKKTIQTMIQSLNPGEKIGLMYHDDTSPIYALATSNEFKDHFEIHQGGNAQGLEGQYYVVDMTTPSNSVMNNPEAFYAYLYTGISRSKQGNLIIMPDADMNHGITVSSAKENVTQEERLDRASIEAYAVRVKDAYKKGIDNLGGLTQLALPEIKDPSTVQINNNTQQSNTPNNATNAAIANANASNAGSPPTPQINPVLPPQQGGNQAGSQQGNPPAQNGNPPAAQNRNQVTNPQPSNNQQGQGAPNGNVPQQGANNTPPQQGNQGAQPQSGNPGTNNQPSNPPAAQSNPPANPNGNTSSNNGGTNNGGNPPAAGGVNNGASSTPVVNNPTNSWATPDKDGDYVAAILYTNQTFELGGFQYDGTTIKPLDSPEQKEASGYRRDSLHGLLSLINDDTKKAELLGDPSKVFGILAYIHNLAETTSDVETTRSDLMTYLQSLDLGFNTSSFTTAEFAIKITNRGGVGNNEFNGAFYKNNEEEKVYFSNTKNGDEKPSNKTINFVVKDSNGKIVFEIPVFSFNSIFNLIESNNLTQARDILNKNPNKLAAIKEIVKYNLEARQNNQRLVDDSVELEMLANLFIINSRQYISLDKWNPNSDTTSFGIQIKNASVAASSGNLANVESMTYAEILAHPRINASEIMVNLDSTIGGINLAPFGNFNPAGKPFIIVTSDMFINDTKEYIEALKNKKAKVIFLTPPPYDYDAFIEQLKDFSSKGGKFPGNNLTIYKLIGMIRNDGDLKKYDEIVNLLSSTNNIMDAIDAASDKVAAAKEEIEANKKKTTREKQLISAFINALYSDFNSTLLAKNKAVEDAVKKLFEQNNLEFRMPAIKESNAITEKLYAVSGEQEFLDKFTLTGKLTSPEHESKKFYNMLIERMYDIGVIQGAYAGKIQNYDSTRDMYNRYQGKKPQQAISLSNYMSQEVIDTIPDDKQRDLIQHLTQFVQTYRNPNLKNYIAEFINLHSTDYIAAVDSAGDIMARKTELKLEEETIFDDKGNMVSRTLVEYWNRTHVRLTTDANGNDVAIPARNGEIIRTKPTIKRKDINGSTVLVIETVKGDYPIDITVNNGGLDINYNAGTTTEDIINNYNSLEKDTKDNINKLFNALGITATKIEEQINEYVSLESNIKLRALLQTNLSKDAKSKLVEFLKKITDKQTCHTINFNIS